MKKDIHPQNYRKVIFKDGSNGAQFLIGSTIATKETGTFEGKEYPLTVIEITSASHPVYTGNEKVLDSAGRVDKFNQRKKVAATKKSK